MKRIIILLSLMITGLAFAQTGEPLPVPAPPGLGAKSYLVVDFHTGRVIAEKNPDMRLEPASLTKMMTAYIVSYQLKQGVISADDFAPVSNYAHSAIGSRTFLEPGSQVTIRNLMYGLVVQSGNDASIALAEHVGGSEEGFVAMMNEMARRLGMTNTSFANATGLPAPDHYSTASDMAKLATAVIRDHPAHYKLYSVKEFEYNGINQKNRNTLLLHDPSVDGIKTGHTQAAGYCLVASAKRGNMRLISVLMGARNEQQRGTESMRALNYGFRFFETVRLTQANQKLGDVQVWGGREDLVSMAVPEERFLTLQAGQKESLQRDFDVSEDLVAPISAGQPIGKVKYTLHNKVVAELPVVALQPVERGNFLTRTADSFKRMMR